ncbi:MAG TPA: hypothetical protein VLB67_11005 [Acidimicrobiia bacterium]|nr:hypothetical protein [Acidimicrobiia bacterium]
MISTATTRTRFTQPVRRAGYAVAVVVNAVLLYVVANVLEWGWLPFLTEDFSRVAPFLGVSIVASIVFNAAYMWYDGVWFKTLGELVTGVLSLVVTIQTYRVFPFDFATSSFPWAGLVRVVLILAMLGIVAGLVAAVMRLVPGRTDA